MPVFGWGDVKRVSIGLNLDRVLLHAVHEVLDSLVVPLHEVIPNAYMATSLPEYFFLSEDSWLSSTCLAFLTLSALSKIKLLYILLW